MQTQEWCVQYHLNTILGGGKSKSTKESFICIISKSTKSSSSGTSSIEKNQKRRTQCNDLNSFERHHPPPSKLQFLLMTQVDFDAAAAARPLLVIRDFIL